MHKHHTHHQHKLAYCPVCDVVYCEECPQEWRKSPVYITYPYYQPYTSPWVVYDSGTTTGTAGDINGFAWSNSAHDHAAE